MGWASSYSFKPSHADYGPLVLNRHYERMAGRTGPLLPIRRRCITTTTRLKTRRQTRQARELERVETESSSRIPIDLLLFLFRPKTRAVLMYSSLTIKNKSTWPCSCLSLPSHEPVADPNEDLSQWPSGQSSSPASETSSLRLVSDLARLTDQWSKVKVNGA